MKIRTYSELVKFKTFEERYQYLRLRGVIGEVTFGFDRYLNQMLYTSTRWKRTRDAIIVRDGACDLGVLGYEIPRHIIIHHMNPITIDDIEKNLDLVYDPEFLICTSLNTHNAIHYGDENLIRKLSLVDRRPNDTCPWRL